MEIAQEEGCAEFSFGRTDPRESGLVAYKRHWGCKEEELGAFRTPGWPRRHANPWSGFTQRIARVLIQHLPARLYGLAGDLFYRHR